MTDNCNNHDHDPGYPERLYKAASDALSVAVQDNGDLTRAAPMVDAIARELGQHAIPDAIVVWVDLYRWGLGLELGSPYTFVFRNSETGEIYGVDEAEPDLVWAGRIIAARINDDKDTFIALVNSSGDDETWRRNVSRTLHIIALRIRHQITTGTVVGLPPQRGST